MAAKKKPFVVTDEHQLAREIEAAKLLLSQLQDLTQGEAGDPDLMRDMVEGETDIRALLARMIDNEACDKELVDGIAARQKKLGERKSRIENRIEKRRALMLTAMQVAMLDKHECTEGTISLRATAVSLEVTQEADIPADYWRDPDPVLDRRALLDALKALEIENAEIVEAHKASGANEPPVLKSIPGAALKPAGQTISIR